MGCIKGLQVVTVYFFIGERTEKYYNLPLSRALHYVRTCFTNFVVRLSFIYCVAALLLSGVVNSLSPLVTIVTADVRCCEQTTNLPPSIKNVAINSRTNSRYGKSA